MNLILADSNELIRIGLRTIFKDPSIQIVGEAETSEELIAQVKSFSPDVLLIDYTSKGFAIDVVPEVLLINPDLKIVAITPEQSAQTLTHAIRSGVMSYVKKDCSLGEIVDAVKESCKGNKFCVVRFTTPFNAKALMWIRSQILNFRVSQLFCLKGK